jgi:hypothetical protein
MRQQIQIQLNPARLSSIIDRAVVASSEIVNLHFKALNTFDLAQPLELDGVLHQFRGPDLSSADRRALHENWVLARAFHELLRAVRHSLEEAHVFVKLLTRTHQVRSNMTLDEFLTPLRRTAASLCFPRLLEAVNSELDREIEFSAAYRSLQIARNCLEHRAGIVSRIETHQQETFSLHVPRLKIFYLRGGSEIEVEPGHTVDPGDDRAEVSLFRKIELRIRSFALGQRIQISLAEFGEIAFACHFLGQQLATRLPKPRVIAP